MEPDLHESVFGLVSPGTRWIDAEPARVELGVLRLRGWHVTPMTPPEHFGDRDIYLIKINADIHQAPGMPAPHWFEIGYTFSVSTGDPMVMDALPRTVREPLPAASHRIGGGLAFVPSSAEAGIVHLPEQHAAVTVYGVGGPDVRWRNSAGAAHLGSRASWLVLAVPSGTPEVEVEVNLRFDLVPEDALGMLPDADTSTFTLRLDRETESVTPETSTPVVHAPGTKAPRVFISYTHDSAAHSESVRKLAEFLCECGIDTHLDRWKTGRSWYEWAMRNIRAADFVLVIASPVCKAVGNAEVGNKSNRGMQSEVALLKEKVHADRETWIDKILPVILPPHGPEDFPDFVLPETADHYKVNTPTFTDALPLLRAITDRPQFRRPQVAEELITFD